MMNFDDLRDSHDRLRQEVSLCVSSQIAQLNLLVSLYLLLILICRACFCFDVYIHLKGPLATIEAETRGQQTIKYVHIHFRLSLIDCLIIRFRCLLFKKIPPNK